MSMPLGKLFIGSSLALFHLTFLGFAKPPKAVWAK
ncbi:hypothetical protein C5S39_13410 [Candidatus Methanophagaceae archaeon]|nr:hypothetical protein C5S39_13410 [Methanophagales archaeon]